MNFSLITQLAVLFTAVEAGIKVRGTVKTEPVVKGGLGSLEIDGTVGKNLVFEKEVGNGVKIKATVGDDVKFAESLGDNVVIQGTIGSRTQFLGSFGNGAKFNGVTQEGAQIKDSFPEGSVFNGQYTNDNKGNLVVFTDKVFASQHILYHATSKSNSFKANTATFEKTPGSGIIFEQPIGKDVVFKGLVGNNVIFKGAIGSGAVFETDIPSGTTLRDSFAAGEKVSSLGNTEQNTQYAPAADSGKTDAKNTGKKGKKNEKKNEKKEDEDKKADEDKTEGKTIKKENSASAYGASAVAFIATLLSSLILA